MEFHLTPSTSTRRPTAPNAQEFITGDFWDFSPNRYLIFFPHFAIYLFSSSNFDKMCVQLASSKLVQTCNLDLLPSINRATYTCIYLHLWYTSIKKMQFTKGL